MTSMIQDLQARGLIAQTTDAVALDALLNDQKIALYCGFDPTADSLHIGKLYGFCTLTTRGKSACCW